MPATTRLRNAKALDRALAKLPREVRERVDQALRDAATDAARDASRRAGAQGGVAALVAPAITVGEAEGGAFMTVDGSHTFGPGRSVIDVLMGAEMGGQARPETMQFEPYRASGYFFGPAAEAAEESAVERASEALDEALQDIP